MYPAPPPPEVKLVEKTIDSLRAPEMPRWLLGDKAYDSNQLDKRLKEKYDIQLIAPNRKNRQKSQDGRSSRKYRRRWKVECSLHGYKVDVI